MTSSSQRWSPSLSATPSEPTGRLGPLEIVDRVVIAAEPRMHRMNTAAELAPNGDLLVTYDEGSDHHITLDEVLMLARSTDLGRTWTYKKAIAALPGWSFWAHHGLTRLGDGTLLHRVMQGHREIDPATGQPRQAYRHRNTRTTWSEDSGRVWQAAGPTADLPPLDTSFTVSYGRVYERDDGRLMACFFGIPRGQDHSVRSAGRSVVLAFSSDRGRTWPEHVLLHDHHAAPDLSCSETDLLRLRNGRLLAMSRANAKGQLYQAFSEDDGLTWGAMAPTGLPGQSPAVVALPSGTLLCLYRDITPGQLGVGVGISRDAGETWEAVGHVYRGPNKDCAYPSPVVLPDGSVFSPYYTAALPEARTGACEIHGVFLRE